MASQSSSKISPSPADVSAHPPIGFGCYKVGRSANMTDTSNADLTDLAEVEQTITSALKAGYRCLDSAQFYLNEREIGLTLKKCYESLGLKRRDLYIVSKVWPDKIYEGREAVIGQLKKTIADLHPGVEEGSQDAYIDLYLVHWPVPGKHVEAYKALEPFVGDIGSSGKLIKYLGISNYSVNDYEELIASGVTIQPYSNQFEINPWLYRKATIDYFHSKGLLLQAYRSLADGRLCKPDILAKPENHWMNVLTEKYKKTPAQILLRWGVQHGFIVLPKSSNEGRIVENFDIFASDFVISEEDMKLMDNQQTEGDYATFKKNYEKCIVRDTPIAGTMEGKSWFNVGDEVFAKL